MHGFGGPVAQNINVADERNPEPPAGHIPLHLQEAYRHLGYVKGDFPASERASDEVLALPMYAELSDAQAEFVIESVRAFFGK